MREKYNSLTPEELYWDVHDPFSSPRRKREHEIPKVFVRDISKAREVDFKQLLSDKFENIDTGAHGDINYIMARAIRRRCTVRRSIIEGMIGKQ